MDTFGEAVKAKKVPGGEKQPSRPAHLHQEFFPKAVGATKIMSV